MWYVGLDVHQKQSTFCLLDRHGKEVHTRTVKGCWPQVLAALAVVPRPFSVCFEASCGYGPLAEKLKKLAQRVVVAHPGQVRLIFKSKRKHDRIDAAKLAKLLFLDEVPAVHVPGVDTRAWRALIEHRQRLVQRRVRVKNQLRALLRGQGVLPPKGGRKALWTKAGLAWLAAADLPTVADELRRDQGLEDLAHATVQIRRAEVTLKALADQHPGVAVLRTIPGVGPRTAEAVVAYLDNPARFGRSKQVGCYFGLVPCQDASADKNRLGHITRQGPATVRKLLTEAAWQGVRRSPTIGAFFARVARDDPGRRKIALVATAHYLARVMHALLRKNEAWREAA
jgi:transposase